MSKGNTLENDVLGWVFRNAPAAWVGNAALHVSLHTADPGESGDQTQSEAAYDGYARVPVTRDANGWTVTGDTAANASAVVFPACTGGASLVTHFAIGTAGAGPGTLLYVAGLTTPLAVSQLIVPSFPALALTVVED